jgi:DNA repair exonuclease SbcCD ATPase subunit
LKIDEVQITHYGPLKPTAKIKLKDFDLFYGKNEYGKTLLIDSMVKILLGRDSQGFFAIDRVDEFPEGYGFVTDEDGKRWKLPKEGDLQQLFGITATEFRNVFIIRNSDLAIPAGEEFAFYRNITERLTGLRTPLIRSIKEKLQRIGNLTKPDSTATLSGSVSSGKLKLRVKCAEELVRKIDELLEEAKKKNFDRLEEQISKTKENEKTTTLEIENLQSAQKREEYEEGMRTLEALSNAIGQLDQLGIFNEDDLQSWRASEKELEKSQKQHKELLAKLAEKKKELEEKNATLGERQREFEVLDARKKIIDQEIRPKLKSYETKFKDMAFIRSREKVAVFFCSVFVALLSVSLIGLSISQLQLFTFFAALFLALALLFVTWKLLLMQKRVSTAALWQEIRLGASRFGLEAENVEQTLAKTQIVDEDYSKIQKAVQELQTDVSVLNREISKLTEEDLLGIEQISKEAEETINNLKMKSRVEKLKDYAEAFKKKQQQEKMNDKFVGILNSHFGQKSKKSSTDENVAYWKEKITELEPYKDKSKEIHYSMKEVLGLRRKAEEIKHEKERLEGELKEFRGKLADIGNEANSNVKPVEHSLLCETLVDLTEISRVLREFVDSVNVNTSNVLEVMKIFEEMEGKEEQKVERLFSENNRVSSDFSEITGGLYLKVEYLSDKQAIRVTMKNGETLTADKLSGGAYDQLYLCIRLALGEKLLKGAKGFFIMDDPFIKADADRLANQLQILKRISEEGWQILYFTAKDEVKNALEKDLASNHVGYHEIENIFS